MGKRFETVVEEQDSDVAPVRKPLYGEHDTPVVYIWPPPDSTKT